MVCPILETFGKTEGLILKSYDYSDSGAFELFVLQIFMATLSFGTSCLVCGGVATPPPPLEINFSHFLRPTYTESHQLSLKLMIQI